MAKKTNPAPQKSRYRDLPGARPLPGSPGLDIEPEQTEGLHPATKLVIGIIIAAVLAFFGFIAGGQGISLFIHWIWVAPLLISIAVIGLGTLLLLGMRKLTKPGWGKVAVTFVGVLLIAGLIGGGIGLTYTFFYQGEIPVAYLDSPQGETIVVMRSTNADRDPDELGGFTTQYTAYQMLNRFFYLSFGDADAPAVFAYNEREPKWAVEWLENDDARLYLPNHEGQPNSETFITVYDLDNLEASVEEKGVGSYLLNATPAPEVTPSPEATPAPTVDPFAY